MSSRPLRRLVRHLLRPLTDSHGPHKPDYLLLSIIGVVIFLGLLMLSSATAYRGYDLYRDSYYFVKQQLFRGILPGLVLFFIFIRWPYFKLKKLGWWWYVFTIVLLLLVFVPHVGKTVNGARSWVTILGITLQTSELAKLTLAIFLAYWLEKVQHHLGITRTVFVNFLLLLGGVALLLFIQPDIGTLAIFMAMSTIMIFSAGLTWTQFGFLIVLFFSGLGLAVKLAPYRLMRLMTFLSPDLDTQGAGYQLKQALIAIGSGGILGLGIGQSRQKFNYLPEVAADSIFAITAEEWGLIFSVVLIILYAIICIRGLRIAKHSPDLFAKFLTIGIIGWITVQTVANIAAIIGLMPLTGLPLPFISLGGSNIAVVLMALAIVTNISKYTKETG